MPPARAELRVRRRRLRGRRGARRARGHGQGRACATTRYLKPHHMRWVLVEATDRILPEVGEEMGALHRRGAAPARHRRTPRDPAGVVRRRPHRALRRQRVRQRDPGLDGRGQGQPGAGPHRPAAGREGPAALPRRPAGRGCRRCLGRGGLRGGPRPDLGVPGATTGPNAQHAVRQAKLLGDNIAAVCAAGRRRTTSTGTSARSRAWACTRALRRSTGSSSRASSAWFMHRTYHVSRMPTLNRKVRVVMDWTLALFFRREVVSLGRLHARATSSAAPPTPPPCVVTFTSCMITGTARCTAVVTAAIGAFCAADAGIGRLRRSRSVKTRQARRCGPLVLILERLLGAPVPLRIRAWDGSVAGAADGPIADYQLQAGPAAGALAARRGRPGPGLGGRRDRRRRRSRAGA